MKLFHRSETKTAKQAFIAEIHEVDDLRWLNNACAITNMHELMTLVQEKGSYVTQSTIWEL